MTGNHDTLTVTTYNTHLGGVHRDYTHLTDLKTITREHTSDIRIYQEVFLPEGDEQAHRIHIPAGHFTATHTLNHGNIRPPKAPAPRYGKIATLVTTKFPITSTHTVHTPAGKDHGRYHQLAITIDAEGEEITIAAVHLSRHRLLLNSARGTYHLHRWANQVTGPVIIAGDHNLWRTSARAIYGRHVTGHNTGPTWPAPRPLFASDHIWTRGYTGTAHTHPDSGSDHLAVTAHLHRTQQDLD